MAWGRPRFAQGKRTSGYRSGFEETVAKHLTEADVKFEYESEKISYTVPARETTYTPDFKLPNGILIEAKAGLSFEASDRQKLLLVREQHPDKDIRLLFKRGADKIYIGSKTTCAEWASKHNFKWAEKRIPEEWILELPITVTNVKKRTSRKP